MSYQDDMSPMFDALTDLTLHQRETIKARYRFLMNEYRRRGSLYTFLFYILRITMTVGSLAVPALLSLKTTGPDSEAILYWFTWGISLAVTTSNGMMTLFKMDKRFFMLHAIAERIRTETWQYLALSGRYSGHYGNVRPTHRNQYVFYCSHLEKIRMKHIEEEYIRAAGDADDKKPMPAAPQPQQSPPSTGKSSLDLHTAETPPQEVPTPPDRAALVSPPPHPHHTNKNPLRRRSDSQSTLGDAADATVIEMGAPANEKEQQQQPQQQQLRPTLQMHERDDGTSVQPARSPRDSLLFTPSGVSGQSTVGL
jgi:hypothetical protein